MKNVLLVSHCDFPSNSAIHVHHFANELVRLKLDCVVCVPNDKHTIYKISNNLYKVTQYSEIEDIVKLFENQQQPDLVHAWTPREHVRRCCDQLKKRFRFKLVIHLEDNEESLLESFLNKPVKEFSQKDISLIPPTLSHPQIYQEFLESADGVTVIIDRLQGFVPAQVSRVTIWPGVDTDEFFPRLPNAELAKSIGIPSGSVVLCYTGNVYPINASEVRSLYLTVGKMNLENKPTVLVRTGINQCDLLSPHESWISRYIIELGFVERARIPDLLALADILIQPGSSNSFNDYRFPSKLPEFLAMGKPVIVPETNIGRFLTHKQNAIILPVADEGFLSDAIDMILQDEALAKSLSEGAINFVKSHLDWGEKGQQLKLFYQSLFDESPQPTFLDRIWAKLRIGQKSADEIK